MFIILCRCICRKHMLIWDIRRVKVSAEAGVLGSACMKMGIPQAVARQETRPSASMLRENMCIS